MMDENEVARRVGERIRRVRTGRGLTLSALGAAVGLSAAALSRIERGEAGTSIANLIRIADRLGLGVADLFEPAAEPPDAGYVLTKAAAGADLVPAAGYAYRRLAGDIAGGRLDAFELTYPVGAPREMALVSHGGEEMLYLIAGLVEFQVGTARFLMEPGDCLHLDCTKPHMGRNAGDVPARMLMVVARPDAAGAAEPVSWWQAGAAQRLAPDAK